MNIKLSKRSIQLLHDLINIEIGKVNKNKEFMGDDNYLQYLSKLKNKLDVKYYHKKYDWYDKIVDEKQIKGLNNGL